MTQVILLLSMFPFLLDIIAASVTNAASPRTAASPRIKSTTKKIFSKTTKLQKFAERLEKECDFALLDEIYKDLKGLWAKVMNEDGQLSKETVDEQNFLKKIVELHNNCTVRMAHIDFERQWEIYLKIFGKEYTATEKEIRKEIFKKKMEHVKKHNELYRKRSVTYTASLNYLSDWTEDELKKPNSFLSAKETPHNRSGRKRRYLDSIRWKHYFYNPFDVVPTSFDWRKKGLVTPVRDQGTCDSCYAIAGLGALEALHKKRTGELVILSVQNILDCTWFLGNNGCVNGFHHKVLEYAQSTGVMLNSRYPYTMNASRNCRWRREDVVTTAGGYYAVEGNSELALRNAIANYGPVAVGVRSIGLDFYHSGIFDSPGSDRADHAVLAIGYGTDPLYGDFWIVRNCWGIWWGESGYVRIARNRNNACQIASYAFFPY